MLLTVSAGEGHNSAMKTIRAKLEGEGADVKVVNVFKDHSYGLKYHIINEGYLMACKYLMPLFNLGFKMCIGKDPSKRDSVGVHGFLKNETASFLKDILEFQPDVIFATHIYGAVMALDLKRTYALPYKVVFLYTDCIIYPYAECAVYADKIITPYDALKENYIKLGHTEDQILPYGIPVKEKFYKEDKTTKTEYRKKLELDEKMFTAMLMLGGGGGDDMFRIFKETIKVTTPIQIIVVCGKDTKTKNKIDKYLQKHPTHHKIVNYGFVTNVEEIMSASDMLMGKCGGLSSTEAICKCLPLMVTTKLPIQEVANYDFMVDNDAILVLGKGEKIADKIEECIKNPDILKTIAKNLDAIRNKDILENTYKALDNLGTAEYTEEFDYLKTYKKSQIKKDVKNMLKAAVKKAKEAKKNNN